MIKYYPHLSNQILPNITNNFDEAAFNKLTSESIDLGLTQRLQSPIVTNPGALWNTKNKSAKRKKSLQFLGLISVGSRILEWVFGGNYI